MECLVPIPVAPHCNPLSLTRVLASKRKRSLASLGGSGYKGRFETETILTTANEFVGFEKLWKLLKPYSDDAFQLWFVSVWYYSLVAGVRRDEN